MRDELESSGLQAINNRFSMNWDGDVLHVRPTRFWSREDADDYLTAYRAIVQLAAHPENGWFKCIDLRSLNMDDASAAQMAQLQSLNAWSRERGLRGIVIIDNPDLNENLVVQVDSGYSGVGIPLVKVADESLARQEFRRMRRRRVGKPASQSRPSSPQEGGD